MARIDIVSTRAKLPASHGPYWRTIRSGEALGYRKTTSGGSWLARVFSGGKMPHKTIGAERDLDYSQALEAAETWWQSLRRGAPRRYDLLAALEDYAKTKTANEPDAKNVW